VTEVFIVSETERYSDRVTILGVMDTQQSADRFVSLQYNDRPDADVEYGVRSYSISTITDEVYEDATKFNDMVDAAQWNMDHKLVKDDAYVGDIKRRKTCVNCGSSIIQFNDGKVKDQGTGEPCPKK
jgi:hemerythrin superfamily protein